MQLKDLKPRQRNKMTEEKHKHDEKHEHADEHKHEEVVETKTEDKKEEKAEKKKETKPKVKKTEAFVKENGIHVSTKKSMAFCKFIRGKRIDVAIKDLEEVAAMKKPVPMKGEIPHRKGEIMAGRYHTKTAKEFIRMLKRLAGNANVNGLENPVIHLAVPNIASRPHGSGGRVRRKRTNFLIIARERKLEAKK